LPAVSALRTVCALCAAELRDAALPAVCAVRPVPTLCAVRAMRTVSTMCAMCALPAMYTCANLPTVRRAMRADTCVPDMPARLSRILPLA